MRGAGFATVEGVPSDTPLSVLRAAISQAIGVSEENVIHMPEHSSLNSIVRGAKVHHFDLKLSKKSAKEPTKIQLAGQVPIYVAERKFQTILTQSPDQTGFLEFIASEKDLLLSIADEMGAERVSEIEDLFPPQPQVPKIEPCMTLRFEDAESVVVPFSEHVKNVHAGMYDHGINGIQLGAQTTPPSEVSWTNLGVLREAGCLYHWTTTRGWQRFTPKVEASMISGESPSSVQLSFVYGYSQSGTAGSSSWRDLSLKLKRRSLVFVPQSDVRDWEKRSTEAAIHDKLSRLAIIYPRREDLGEDDEKGINLAIISWRYTRGRWRVINPADPTESAGEALTPRLVEAKDLYFKMRQRYTKIFRDYYKWRFLDHSLLGDTPCFACKQELVDPKKRAEFDYLENERLMARVLNSHPGREKRISIRKTNESPEEKTKRHTLATARRYFNAKYGKDIGRSKVNRAWVLRKNENEGLERPGSISREAWATFSSEQKSIILDLIKHEYAAKAPPEDIVEEAPDITDVANFGRLSLTKRTTNPPSSRKSNVRQEGVDGCEPEK